MIVVMAGPNQFTKLRERRKMTADGRVVRIYGEDGLAPWYESLGQTDLFGESSSIVGERVLDDLAAADQEKLVEHLTSIAADNQTQKILFMVHSEAQLNKGALGQYLQQFRIMKFPLPTASQAGIWLQQEAASMGVQIEKPALIAMVDKFGADQFALKTELSRWALLPNSVITRAMVDGMVPLQSDVDNFDVVNSWAKGRSAKAIDQLMALRRQGIGDQAVIGSLAWKLETLLLSAKAPAPWTRPHLEEAAMTLHDLDLGIKQGKVPAALGLELWIIESQP